MHTVLAFPALAGMAYPALADAALVRVVPGPEAIPALPEADRAAVPIRVCALYLRIWKIAMRCRRKPQQRRRKLKKLKDVLSEGM